MKPLILKHIQDHAISPDIFLQALQNDVLRIYLADKRTHSQVRLEKSDRVFKNLCSFKDSHQVYVAPFVAFGVHETSSFCYIEFVRSVRKGYLFDAIQTYINSVSKPVCFISDTTNADIMRHIHKRNYVEIK